MRIWRHSSSSCRCHSGRNDTSCCCWRKEWGRSFRHMSKCSGCFPRSHLCM